MFSTIFTFTIPYNNKTKNLNELFFFPYHKELVYNSKFLLYAVLSITSMSTIQFVFTFIEEALYPLFGASSPRLSQLSYNDLHGEYQEGDVDTDSSAFVYDNNLKNSNKLMKSKYLFWVRTFSKCYLACSFSTM